MNMERENEFIEMVKSVISQEKRGVVTVTFADKDGGIEKAAMASCSVNIEQAMYLAVTTVLGNAIDNQIKST